MQRVHFKRFLSGNLHFQIPDLILCCSIKKGNILHGRWRFRETSVVTLLIDQLDQLLGLSLSEVLIEIVCAYVMCFYRDECIFVCVSVCVNIVFCNKKRFFSYLEAIVNKKNWTFMIYSHSYTESTNLWQYYIWAFIPHILNNNYLHL
jgi:hypothetical protein